MIIKSSTKPVINQSINPISHHSSSITKPNHRSMKPPPKPSIQLGFSVPTASLTAPASSQPRHLFYAAAAHQTPPLQFQMSPCSFSSPLSIPCRASRCTAGSLSPRRTHPTPLPRTQLPLQPVRPSHGLGGNKKK